MYRIRHWSVRNARALEAFYNGFERILVKLHPLWKLIGYQRLEKPFAAAEKLIKGVLFDCQMCGQCVLSSTGMSCSMNCPKNLRNGPCGGVRGNGNCEVYAEMKCVWVAAWEGSQKMKGGHAISQVQQPIDFLQSNKSSWLNVARTKNSHRETSGH
ncbi:hypothetical protein AB833_15255 [Chromatiales bacterium (ex Bugula neritina AB1)]|nr:hypothetical protein AB833_15255 [Chromatiales bacterium (ex Bugula neritina AB1)]